MKQKKRHVHLYLSEEVYRRLRMHCEEYKTTIGGEVERAIVLYLDAMEYREDPVKMMRERRKPEE